ncbi:hypothetical protein ACFY8Z_36690 [Streptomyces microflavus]|uniref:hypothetical protein n=1 Tax=Streptomyces microflavus TaxID=1919 RepID=UPI0036EC7441
MKTGLGTAIVVAAKAAEQIETPRPLHIAISLAVGVLVAITAGKLHRSDRPLTSQPRYSIQAAVMRAGIALFGTAALILATLRSPQQGASFLILLLAAVTGVAYGLLSHADASIQASIWKGATVAASACGLGQAFLALYS